MPTQLAAQMFTLRDHCQDAQGIADSCAKLKAMGYDAIQASAAAFDTIEADELKTILDDTGMICCATHRSMEQLEDTQASLDYHAAIDCKYTAIGGWGWNGQNTRQEWADFAKSYNAVASKYAGSDFKLGYHNHSHELAPFDLLTDPAGIDPANTPLHMLADQLVKECFFEIDTYWIAHGGGDPALWLANLAGRIPCIHLKDLVVTPSREHKMCEVGAGNLNWPAILKAAKSAGVEWYIIERDAGDLDPFESLKISLENCKQMGLS